MAEDTQRTVLVERGGPSRFVATNVRGGTLEMGTGDDAAFTPVELLLAAMAGCSGIDVDILTSRRSDPTRFVVSIRADKVRDDHGNHLANVEMTFDVTFPVGDAGDAARQVLPDAVRRSHDRLCTVTRTVVLATPVSARTRD